MYLFVYIIVYLESTMPLGNMTPFQQIVSKQEQLEVNQIVVIVYTFSVINCNASSQCNVPASDPNILRTRKTFPNEPNFQQLKV